MRLRSNLLELDIDEVGFFSVGEQAAASASPSYSAPRASSPAPVYNSRPRVSAARPAVTKSAPVSSSDDDWEDF